MKNLVFSTPAILLGVQIIFAQPFNSQVEWEQYFKNRIQDLDPIEGIWSQSFTLSANRNGIMEESHNYSQIGTYAIYKSGISYSTYNFGSNADNSVSSITFSNTATQGIYLMNINYPLSNTSANSTSILTSGLLEFTYEQPNSELIRRMGHNVYNYIMIYEHQWIKLFPKEQDYVNNQPSSGSGFAISTNGIIVSNYHVIDGASSIKVRGVNSDYSKTYNAKTLVSDKNNDLALIQIDDIEFTTIAGTIPYVIKTSLSGVGESVFTLGYPLRATMGDEIKLTNGIISSKTGFQGDISTYQISVPVQPGNSGCPLFDGQGNVIGIINAKHSGAENVSYAVKASYLTNLIELLPTPPKLQTVNTLAGKTLVQQVEGVKKFVYIIETE